MDPSRFGDQLPVLPLQCFFLCPPQLHPGPTMPSPHRADGTRGNMGIGVAATGAPGAAQHPTNQGLGQKVLLESKIQAKSKPLNRMGWRLVMLGGCVTPALGSLHKSCTSPGTDGGLSRTFCLGHGGAPRWVPVQSGWVLDAGAEAGDACVSALAAPRSPAPSPCHRRPPACLHLHPTSSPYPRVDILMAPKRPSKGPNSILKQGPLSSGGDNIFPVAAQAQSHRFCHAPSCISQEIPRKRRIPRAKARPCAHPLPAPSTQRLGGQGNDTQGY